MLNRRTVLKGGIVLAATSHTATAGGQTEPICDRVERLAMELSEALDEWNGGRFMGMIYPASDPRSVSLRPIRLTQV